VLADGIVFTPLGYGKSRCQIENEMGRRLIAIAALVVVSAMPAVSQPDAGGPPASLYLGVALEDCISHSGTIGVQPSNGRQSCSISLQDCKTNGWRPIHRPSRLDNKTMVWICRISRPKP
jgi:hypothetical protein